ncbi:MAG: cobyric acid synthase CobQ, partial [Prochlorothrix sp.]
ERRGRQKQAELTIGVIRFPHISNFTDFDPLEAEPSVRVRYIGLGDELAYPDAIVLPGSKTTIADLLALQETGLARKIQDYAAAGGTVLGVCGGFQMMGQDIIDPEGVEGYEGRFPGLQLLPLRTYFGARKITRQRQVTSRYPQDGLPVQGYELHQGSSKVLAPDARSAGMAAAEELFDEPGLGLVSESQAVWGTYLHGVFDNGPWRRAWLNRLRQQRGLKALPTGISNYRTEREAMLDRLADVVAEHLDLEPLLKPVS